MNKPLKDAVYGVSSLTKYESKAGANQNNACFNLKNGSHRKYITKMSLQSRVYIRIVAAY